MKRFIGRIVEDGLEENALIRENAVIGYDHEEDKKLYHVTESGIIVIEGARAPLQLSTIRV